MPERALHHWLFDILQAIVDIRGIVGDRTFADYQRDWIAKRVVERELEIISEASRHIPDDVKASHSHIPWAKVAGLGNVLRHSYPGVDHEQVWAIVQNELETLNAAVSALYAARKRPSDPWPDIDAK